MYESLSRLSALPEETEVYCGHEYTLANLQFAADVEPHNADIRARLAEVTTLREQGRSTVPANLATEKRTNPFLRCDLPVVRAAAEAYAGRTLPRGSDVLAAIREWKNRG
jgi:hydroxyacylglutathione hydrolase